MDDGAQLTEKVAAEQGSVVKVWRALADAGRGAELRIRVDSIFSLEKCKRVVR